MENNNKNSKFIILPSILEDIDLMVQDNLRVYDFDQMVKYRNRADSMVPNEFPSSPLKYIDIRAVFFAPDLIPLLKRIVDIYEMPPEKISREELKSLSIQAIQLIKKIDKAFQQ